MFQKPPYNDSWKGVVLKSIIIDSAQTYNEIQRETGMNDNALNRALAELMKLEIIEKDKNNNYQILLEELIPKYRLYYHVSSEFDKEGYALLRVVLDPIIGFTGLIMCIAGIAIPKIWLIFIGLLLVASVITFEIFLYKQEQQRPISQKLSAEENESFLHYFRKNTFSEYPFFTDIKSDITSTYDEKHATIQNFILSMPLLGSNEEQKIEYYFNHYGQRGYIDIIKWIADKDNIEALIGIIEIKSKIENVGETIRQIHNYIDYITKDVDPIFGKFKNKDVISFLVLKLNHENVEVVRKFEQTFKSSELDVILFVDEQKRQLFFTYCKTISLPTLDQNYLDKYTCYYCGKILKSTQNECSDCLNTPLICAVCKLPISFGEEIGMCSLCETKGHIIHMQEWVKTQGKCPVCLQNLPVEGIVTEEISKLEKK